MRYLMAAIGLVLCLVSSAWPQTGATPSIQFFFRMDWCPTNTEAEQLLQGLHLVRVGCCVYKASPRAGVDEQQVLAPFVDKLIPAGDVTSACVGIDRDAVALAEEQRRMDAAEAAAWRAREASELPGRQASERRRLPTLLAEMTPTAFCEAYGKAARGEQAVAEWLPRQEEQTAFRAAAKKRGLRISEDLVMGKSVRIGASQCDVYAALGPPSVRNRTVNAFGESLQLVYGRLLVYVSRGVVTAWQD